MKRDLLTAAMVLGCLIVTVSAVRAAPQESSAEESEVGELLDAGETSFQQGNYHKAIREFTKAFELSGNRSMIALYGIGRTYLRLSKFEEAQEYGEKILELDDREVNQAAAEGLIGSALLGRALDGKGGGGQPELLAKAESHLRASLDFSSGQMRNAWFNLSVALQEQNRLAEALEAQQEYVNRTPESRPARARLCELDYLARPTSEDPAKVTTRQVDQAVAEEQEPVADRSAPEESESQENPAQTPLKVGGDVLPPQKLHTPQATYTEEARLARMQGVVILEAIIDELGTVTDVKVLKGLPMGLSTSAALTACQWQFEPATLHGKPVPVYLNLTTRFSLGRKRKD